MDRFIINLKNVEIKYQTNLVFKYSGDLNNKLINPVFKW